jgi:hypothetical protein
MKVLLAIALVAGVVTAAETNSVVKVRRGAWYTKQALAKVTKNYVAQKQIQFTFEGTTSGVAYRKVGANFIATIWFGSGLGRPVLTADIDHTGTVLTNCIRIAVCGTGREP